MELWQFAVLVAAGTVAGGINAVVGSGSLVSFPTLLALGYPPVLANVVNNIGVLPGSIAGAFGYRRLLVGQWRIILPLVIGSGLGGAAGAALLLVLPSAVFDAVVPALILLACLLVVTGPAIKRYSVRVGVKKTPRREIGPAVVVSATLTGTYGGYFGAAQGVISLSLLSIFLDGGIQRANAIKNVLAAAANGAASVYFIVAHQVDWLGVLALAIGAALGGQAGARVAIRIPELAFRIVIFTVGVAVSIYMIVN